jgi:hypothetical protein
MNKYVCRCGKFVISGNRAPRERCQLCNTVPKKTSAVQKSPKIKPCEEHDWLNKLDETTGLPCMVCQNCGLRKTI